MKSCPQCGRSYSDSESFCDVDGTALARSGTTAGGTRSAAAAPGAITCAACGGTAQPQDEVCRFCGATLPARGSAGLAAPGAAQTRRQTSSRLQSGQSFDDERPPGSVERSRGRRLLAGISYALAAIVALVAGAWFALRLSSKPPQQPQVAERPAPSALGSPAVSAGPMVALARNVPIEVRGESAAAPARNVVTAQRIFANNISSLLEIYKHTLEADNTVRDGTLVTLRIAPNGEVVAASVKTSTSPNPSLDAEVVKNMMGWRFGSFGGSSVEVNYPVVFAHDSAEQAAIETALGGKLASLSPAEPAEYTFAASTPAAGASPELAAVTPEAVPTKEMVPTVESEEATAAEARAVRKRRRKTELASLPRRPTLLQQVEERLQGNRNLRRVHAYTNGGAVTLYGKVFDEDAKRLAERTARSVDGVNQVIDNLTTDSAQWAAWESRVNQDLQNAGLNKVTVKVIGNDAYLAGEVSSESEKEHAVTVAEGAAPVRVRTNLIRVTPKGVFGF